MSIIRPPLTEANSEKVRNASQALHISLEEAANIFFDSVTEVEIVEIITITVKPTGGRAPRRYSKRNVWKAQI